MRLEDLRSIVVLLTLIALIGAATAIALSDFRTSDGITQNDSAYNISTNGLRGIDNATSYLDTTGTIAGVAVLIGIVVLAFAFMRR